MKYYNKVDEINAPFEYTENQYENHNGGKFEFREMIFARYVKSSNSDYKENPLIEGLPVSKSVDEIIDSIENIVPFSLEERNMCAIDRLDKIEAIDRLFIFQYEHANIATKIDRVMRNGYVDRGIPTMKTLSECDVKIEDLHYFNFMGEQEQEIPSGIIKESAIQPKGFPILGSSGAGKTTTIKRILTTYPRLIVHTDNHGQKILFKQVPWIKIEGTYSRSLKGIAISFFQELDDVLGTTYVQKFKKLSIDEQIVQMRKMSVRHQIGLFVVDEIQYINQNSKDEVVNYLNKLHNLLPMPIVYIGTHSLESWIKTIPYTLRRRMEGTGLKKWKKMQNDMEFENFISQLWHYQWIKNPPKLTREMMDVFYKNTMGLTERIIRLFQLCQINAIELESETFTASDVDGVSKEMPFTSEIIEALRNEDYSNLDKLEGMLSEDSKKLVQNRRMTVREREVEKQAKMKIESKDYTDLKVLKSELMSYALQLDFNESMVKEAVKQVTKGKKKQKNIKAIKQEMVQLLFQMKSENNIEKQLVPLQSNIDETIEQRIKVNVGSI